MLLSVVTVAANAQQFYQQGVAEAAPPQDSPTIQAALRAAAAALAEQDRNVDPKDAPGLIYPAAKPYVHENIPAEPYVHVDIPAEPYIHEEPPRRRAGSRAPAAPLQPLQPVQPAAQPASYQQPLYQQPSQPQAYSSQVSTY